MRLIDADALNVYDISPVDGFVVMGVTEEDIDLTPTINAVSVVRGEWIKEGCAKGSEMCNQCGFVQFEGRVDNYCPNCGAKMDKEKSDERCDSNDIRNNRHGGNCYKWIKEQTMIREYIYFVDDNPNGTSGMTAQEVVRCQDCKYWVYNFNGCSRNPCTEPWYATDFCSYGERESE